MSAPYEGDSTTSVPGIKGTNTTPGGVGVYGTGANGVEGVSAGGTAVNGIASKGGTGIAGGSDTGYGVWGSSTTSIALRGDSYGPAHSSSPSLTPRPGPVPFNLPPPKNTAIYGNNMGLGADTAGVLGRNDAVGGYGVLGWSDRGHGVRGFNDITAGGSGTQPDRGTGVSGDSANGYGVFGASRNWEGVRGVGHGGAAGVAGFNDAPPAHAQAGVWGESKNGGGVIGVSHTPSAAAIAGFSPPGGLAGYFAGNVTVTGNHTCNDVFLSGADCAEQFDIANADSVEPGTVMALGEGGILEASQFAYDKRVAGVVSGAGSYKPGIVLDKQESQPNRKPIALVGKVYCKVDAQYGAVETGDLLTTSPTPGHAMKATDQLKAFGAVVGKALRSLKEGRGLIPILIALQ
jgi:hypothetical protein